MRSIPDYSETDNLLGTTFQQIFEQITGMTLVERVKPMNKAEEGVSLITTSYGAIKSRVIFTFSLQSADMVLNRMNHGKCSHNWETDLIELVNIIYGRMVSRINDRFMKSSRFHIPCMFTLSASGDVDTEYERSSSRFFDTDDGFLGYTIAYTLQLDSKTNSNRKAGGEEDMKKVLIIDDSPFIVKEISQICEEHGYKVVGRCKTGEEGVVRYKEMQPDVVTLDIIMPGMDGIETAQKIKEIDSNARIVMMSSLCDYDTMQEIQELGISRLVPKPIVETELLGALEAALMKID